MHPVQRGVLVMINKVVVELGDHFGLFNIPLSAMNRGVGNNRLGAGGSYGGCSAWYCPGYRIWGRS